MQTEQLLCWSGITDIEHSTKFGSNYKRSSISPDPPMLIEILNCTAFMIFLIVLKSEVPKLQYSVPAITRICRNWEKIRPEPEFLKARSFPSFHETGITVDMGRKLKRTSQSEGLGGAQTKFAVI